jgi:hypothetical protein
LTVNATATDVPPPGGGLVTEILPTAPLAMRPAGITAVILVLELTVVLRAVVPKFATDELMKFDPAIVIVRSPDPARMELGEI